LLFALALRSCSSLLLFALALRSCSSLLLFALALRFGHESQSFRCPCGPAGNFLCGCKESHQRNTFENLSIPGIDARAIVDRTDNSTCNASIQIVALSGHPKVRSTRNRPMGQMILPATGRSKIIAVSSHSVSPPADRSERHRNCLHGSPSTSHLARVCARQSPAVECPWNCVSNDPILVRA